MGTSETSACAVLQRDRPVLQEDASARASCWSARAAGLLLLPLLQASRGRVASTSSSAARRALRAPSPFLILERAQRSAQASQVSAFCWTSLLVDRVRCGQLDRKTSRRSSWAGRPAAPRRVGAAPTAPAGPMSQPTNGQSSPRQHLPSLLTLPPFPPPSAMSQQRTMYMPSSTPTAFSCVSPSCPVHRWPERGRPVWRAGRLAVGSLDPPPAPTTYQLSAPPQIGCPLFAKRQATTASRADPSCALRRLQRRPQAQEGGL